MSAAAAQPGFVNAHTHLYSGLAPFGLPQPPSPPPETFWLPSRLQTQKLLQKLPAELYALFDV